MARNEFRNGASLFRVLENSPIDHLKQFVLQGDQNFQFIRATAEAVFAEASDEASIRKRLFADMNNLPPDHAEPVEVECRRVLDLIEGKGPTSLQTIADRRLSNEECEEFTEQPGELAKSLWMHVNHRGVFDDAISFRSVRLNSP